MDSCVDGIGIIFYLLMTWKAKDCMETVDSNARREMKTGEGGRVIYI